MRSRLLLVLALAAGTTSLVATGTSAGAQIERNEITTLKAERDQLRSDIATLDAAIAEADAVIATQNAALVEGDVEQELLADDLARTVEARRAPAAAREQIALDSYISGDPRSEALLNELSVFTPDLDNTLQRELYDAALTSAIDGVAAIDAQLLDLRGRVEQVRSDQEAARAVLDETTISRRVTIDDRTVKATRLDTVLERIDWLESLANRAILTGLVGFNDPSRPALIVKIDNVEAARPQIGINRADVVFEELVEGGFTRLAAIFHSNIADPVGPVRSMRTSDINLFAWMNRPLFANSGGNGAARGAVAESDLIDVGHSSDFSDLYSRNRERRAPHNLYANTSEIWAAASNAELDAGAPPPMFRFRTPDDTLPASATPVGGVAIRYGSVDVTYTWNGTGWARTQDGSPHVDANGVVAAPANVIVQFINYRNSFADAASPEAIAVGSGTAWIFTDGNVIEGSWSRLDEAMETTYTDADGAIVALTPGSTWISLPKPGNASLL